MPPPPLPPPPLPLLVGLVVGGSLVVAR